jgi:thiol-disulfide isomerase/thioredoxin
MSRPALCALLVGTIGLAACAPGAGLKTPNAAAGPGLPEGAPRAPLAWADFSPATFAKAKAAHKFIVLDGSAEWCHWCHVMEATTYHDPTVAAILAEHFVAVKVDIDARPDIGERYGDWGWPATVIFSPDAQEIGKYRGYIAPNDFVDILKEVVATGAHAAGAEKIRTTPLVAPRGKLTDAELSYIERDTELSLDEYYDDEQGGWGRSQKAPIYGDNQWALVRAAQGDKVMRERVLFTLAQQNGVIDPVWGGVYQYSVGHDWTKPHFEKLMPFEAGALENYATAYALTGDPRWLLTAHGVRKYLEGFLLSKEGGFYASQDADLNAHDPDEAISIGARVLRPGRCGATGTRHSAGRLARVRAREWARDRSVRGALRSDGEGRHPRRGASSPRPSVRPIEFSRRICRLCGAEVSRTMPTRARTCSISPTTRPLGTRS